MKAQKQMSVWGSFFFFFFSTVHFVGEIRGSRDHFMPFSCIQSLYGDAGKGHQPVLLALLKMPFPFQNNG